MRRRPPLRMILPDAPMNGHTRGSLLGPIVALVAWRAGWCNARLVAAWRALGIDAVLVTPGVAHDWLGRDDVIVNRLDVAPSLDGIEPGLGIISGLERSGVRIVNRPCSLAAAHDKLETARRLESAHVPQPHSVHVPAGARGVAGVEPPLVLKPRFGSWGTDVMLCRTRGEVDLALEWSRRRRWFRRHGAIAQAYVPHAADLRVVVAAGRVIGAIERRPARGDWRTNFSLGGSRRPVVPAMEAADLARAAADAVGADLVGIDLIAAPDGYIVMEINGAVDFDRLYSLPGRDAYHEAADLLRLPVVHRRAPRRALMPRGRPHWIPATRWQAAVWR